MLARMSFNSFTVAGLVILAGGIVIASFLIRHVRDRSRFRSTAVRTTGTIVGEEIDTRSEGDNDGPPPRYYIAEFTTQNGTVTRARSRTSFSPAASWVGAAATVHYNPANPSEIDLDTGRTSALNGCTFAAVIALAAVAFIVGLVLLISGLVQQ